MSHESSRLTQLRVGALVVTWNRRDDALDCLGSLFRSSYPDLTVYVVDNASEDDTRDAIACTYPQVRLIRSDQNLGFAGGNNLGMRAIMADGLDAIFLVNDDVVVSPDAVSVLVKPLSDPHVGVTAPKVLVHSAPDVIWSAGGTIHPSSGVATQRFYGELDSGQADEIADVDYAVGCAMLVRSDVIRKVGSLDTSYFMYYEEADWCRRIRAAGYRILCVPQSRVWHKVSIGDNGRNNAAYYCSRNRLLFLRTAGATPGRIAWITFSDILRSAVVHAAKGRVHESRLLVKAVLDYYRNRLGAAEGLP